MRTLALAILFGVALSANAAITEKYASAAGAGNHDGSDAANAFSWTEMIADINAGSKAGNRYNYTGDLARGANSDTISGAGTSTSPIVIRGYLSSIGDGYQGRTNGNAGLIPANMPAISYTGLNGLTVSGNYIVVESLSISGTKNGALVSFSGVDNTIRACKIVNTTTGASGQAFAIPSGNYQIAQNCDIALANGGNAGDVAVVIASTGGGVYGCRITSSKHGVSTSGNGIIANNMIYNCGSIGITNAASTSGPYIIHNTITGCTADAIGIPAGNTGRTLIINNCLTDNGGWGINTSGAMVILANNRTRDNSSGAITGSDDWVAASNWGAVTTDTGGPETDYVNASITDYRLISTSPAKATGIPLYSDIGALQRQESVSGGSYTFGN